MTKLPNTAVILLAGGIGSRMQSQIPKQFLSIRGKVIIDYSLELFLNISIVQQIIIVCEDEYQARFNHIISDKEISFARPGQRRQDSVFNGLQKVSPSCPFTCIHDSARPFITPEIVHNVLKAGYEHGASVVAMPVKFTVKESNQDEFVHQTLDRNRLWEIQTPQVANTNLLKEGFHFANTNQLTVTDDVSLIELIKQPVKIVKGAYTNIKITTPDDLLIAEQFAS